jgi:hypothetical protein
MQLGQRLVEAWRHDRSGYTDADRTTLARQQARFTALTAADLPGRLAAIPDLADLLARQPLRVSRLGLRRRLLPRRDGAGLADGGVDRL